MSSRAGRLCLITPENPRALRPTTPYGCSPELDYNGHKRRQMTDHAHMARRIPTTTVAPALAAEGGVS